nr:hypothetical protein [Gammaproteobacteria bacterium]
MKRRIVLKFPLLGIALGNAITGEAVRATPPSALEEIVTTWSQGLPELAPEEARFLTRFAVDRQQAIDTRSGFFEAPGTHSAIVRQPPSSTIF